MKINKNIFENGDNTEGVRINKYLADAGVCSRREGDKAVSEGRVTIDGETAVMGSKVLPGQCVCYNGRQISKVEELVLIALNKPEGIVCTTDRRDPDNVIDFISHEKRIFPIGRLDKDSSGLLLLTNDGNIVNKILRAGNFHEKEYLVTVNKDITKDFLEKMSTGVEILDTVTRPCFIEQTGKQSFRIILTQGLNRQIRRMCEALGYRVRSLQRIRIMNINLGRLKVGTYRNITPEELAVLNEMLTDSSNTPVELKQEAKAQVVISVKEKPARRPYHEKSAGNSFGGKSSGERKPSGEKGGFFKKSTINNGDRKNGKSGNGRTAGPSKRIDREALHGSKGLRAGRPRADK